MRHFTGTLLLTALFLSLSAFADKDEVRKYDMKTQDNHLLVVVDRSGSMDAELPKIKSTLGTVLDPRKTKGHKFGLIHFSGCGPETIKYAVELKEGTGQEIMNVVSGLKADGATDLIGALNLAKKIMMDKGICARLALFTDHMDTCSANSQINEVFKGIDAHCIQVNVITYAQGRDLEFLEGLANETGGALYEAQTTKDMVKALEKIRDAGAKNRTPSTFDIKKKEEKKEPMKETKKQEEEAPALLPAVIGGAKKPEQKSNGGKP